MEAPSYDLYPVLRLQQLGSIVVVQPQAGGAAAGPSFTCDLETGTLALAEHPQVDKNFTDVYGVLGMATLEAGPALVVITGVEQVGGVSGRWPPPQPLASEQVAALPSPGQHRLRPAPPRQVAVVRGYPCYRVASTQVLADTRNGRWKAVDGEFLRLLRAGTDPRAHGGSLYFGHGGDLTLSHQRHEDAAAGGAAGQGGAQEAWQRAEPAFFWNAALAKPLLGERWGLWWWWWCPGRRGAQLLLAVLLRHCRCSLVGSRGRGSTRCPCHASPRCRGGDGAVCADGVHGVCGAAGGRGVCGARGAGAHRDHHPRRAPLRAPRRVPAVAAGGRPPGQRGQLCGERAGV